jgi:Na+-translocating ferredoxin:NAD+ oxidoreductase RnfG subunit
VGAVRERVGGDDQATPELWLAEIDSDTAAVVAVASAPGYRSRIDVAVTVASDGTILSERVAAHSESAYVGHILDRGGADALSGATVTAEGIRSATGAAIAAARGYIEEQW